MGIEELNRIKEFFKANGIKPTYLEHEPVITSEEAAATRGFKMKQGIKAIVIKDESEHFAVVCLPADKKVDIKKAAASLGWPRSQTRMGTPEEVLKHTGCEIGAVPPFGHKTPLPILMDSGVYDNEENAFNIGLRTQSAKVKTSDMKLVFSKIKVTEGDFAK